MRNKRAIPSETEPRRADGNHPQAYDLHARRNQVHHGRAHPDVHEDIDDRRAHQAATQGIDDDTEREEEGRFS